MTSSTDTESTDTDQADTHQTFTDQTFTGDQLSTALNRAAEEVLGLARIEGEDLVRDVVNLVINAGLYFLEHPEALLEDAVRENYDDDFADELLESLR